MTKIYDQKYFEHWYRNQDNANPSGLVRKVALAVSLAEYYLERPLRSVLDVGCGEAAWRAPLLKLRPKLDYRGVDSSEYVITRYGRSRNIAFARFGQLAELRFGAPVDLLICSDVLHYIPTNELKRGLSGFSELCSGLAFLELYAKGDEIEGDLNGFLPRSAKNYRHWFAAAGFTACGPHSYLSESLRKHVTSMEVPG